MAELYKAIIFGGALFALGIGTQIHAEVIEIDTSEGASPGITLITGFEFEDEGVILEPIGGGLNLVRNGVGCLGSHTDTTGTFGDWNGGIRLSFVDPNTGAPAKASFVSIEVVNPPVVMTAYDELGNILGTDVLTQSNDFLTVTSPGIAYVDLEGSFWCIFNLIQFELELIDVTAPEIECMLATDLLWPPNHQLVDVGLDVLAVDDQDENPTVEVLVFSNEDDDEATGSGSASPDAFDDGTVLELRAERSGKGNGRVYLIVIIATDAAGNSSYDCCSVVVPHSNSKKSIAKAQEHAEFAEDFCAQFGHEPPGFVPVGE